jgi:hypothetical protein
MGRLTMAVSLGRAALIAGKSKNTITRWIEAGKLSADRGENGAYAIDEAELSRVFKLTPEGPHGGEKAEIEELRARLDEVRAERDAWKAHADAWRAQADAWRAQAERLAVIAESKPKG